MLIDFIAFGGILFWSIVAVAGLAITALIDEDRIGRATVVLFVVAAALFGVSKIPLVEFFSANPRWIAYIGGGYFLGAAIWAIAKWRLFFLPKLFERYEEVRAQFLKDRNLKELPAGQTTKDELLNYASKRGVYINNDRMVRNNKVRIMTWMAYWPFSLLGTFIGDFLHRMFVWIYNAIGGSLQRLSDRMAARYTELN